MARSIIDDPSQWGKLPEHERKPDVMGDLFKKPNLEDYRALRRALKLIQEEGGNLSRRRAAAVLQDTPEL